MPDDRWVDLAPDPEMLRALQQADSAVERATAISGTRDQRNKWSNRFADACAVMVARQVRSHASFEGLVVRPTGAGPAEPLTFVAGEREKKVDVVVSSIVSGLQVGFSLKGMNFRDSNGLQFDKNLTGRTYELQDEVSVIHRYQPASVLVALYFMPLASTDDKRSDRRPSSFARAVAHLRARTGRLDPALPSQMDRVDAAAVGLFVPGDSEQIGDFSYQDDVAKGVARYFDVEVDPPRRGRPRVETTMNLGGLIDLVARKVRPSAEQISWADPEE